MTAPLRSLRVGMISGEFPPAQGGVGDFTTQLTLALARAGHQVAVLTSHGAGAAGEPAQEGLTVHRSLRGWGWGSWRALARLADYLGCDVLNVQYQTAAYRMHPAINFFPGWLRRRGGPPVVVTFHDLRVPYLFPKAGGLRWRAVRALAQGAAGVVVTTREDERALAAEGLALPHLARIPIGSNIAPQLPTGFDRSEWRARWGVAPGDLLLGYFGFLNERKGGNELIGTLALLVERGLPAHLLLIGGRLGTADPTNAAFAAHVDALIAARGLPARVHSTGFVAPEEVSASLAAVDVCVLPYHEGASLRHGSLHACLAHARPIATTTPEVETPELVDGANVRLVPPHDVAALAAAVAELAIDPARAARLGAAAGLLAREFTWERIAARTAELYAEVRA
jgi:glycosyltransferase involved in cell wall biosynthesis